MGNCVPRPDLQPTPPWGKEWSLAFFPWWDPRDFPASPTSPALPLGPSHTSIPTTVSAPGTPVNPGLCPPC